MNDLSIILQGCVDNDSRSQLALYERFFGYSLKIVFRYIFQYDKAKDVTNDGFVKLFRNINRFEIKDSDSMEPMLLGWIRRIMVNTAIDELRRHIHVPQIGYVPDYVWEPGDSSQKTDDQVLYKELIEMVRKLPPAYRAVFNMHVMDGFSHQEIATMLGINVGTSKSNLAKAKTHLKNMLTANETAAAKQCRI